MHGSGAVSCSCPLLIRGPNLARCQAKAPLIALCRFSKPALSREVPNFGTAVWGGRCSEAAATCRMGPDTTADDDLHRARFFISGLVAEWIVQMDTPGSSIDDLVKSQAFGGSAAKKLADRVVLSGLSDGPELDAYLHQFWHEH